MSGRHADPWRRSLVAGVVTAVLATLLAGCTLGGDQGAVRAIPAQRALPIPPVAESAIDDEGRRVIDLDIRETAHDFGEGEVPGTWAATAGDAGTSPGTYPGTYLGPTIRVERGETMVVNVANGTDEMTTLHWHGMHVPARMDGGPHSMVQPGTTWSPTWTVDQPAATLWYHPHPHGQTAEQIYRGLAGLLLIDDPDAEAELPSEYGVDDVPVVVQDKAFTPEGNLDMTAGSDTAVGFVGDTIVVNGAVGAFHEVRHERVRLRLLNASTGRVYRFALSDGRPFHVVGSDGGLLPAPVERRSVQLSPAERAEIVVEMQPSETVRLVSRTPELGGRIDAARLFGGGTFDVLELRADDRLAPSPPLPTVLADLPAADASDAAHERSFVLGGRVINGRLMDMGRIDEVVPLGRTENWSVTNQANQPHNFHVHDGQFRVLSMDGDPPPAHLAGWKDTVYVAPTTTVVLQVRFDTYADPSFPYMYHCHLTIHEDEGMMGQFVVVEPGTPDSAVSSPAG